MIYHQYFKETTGYFWHWEEHEEVVAIPGGSTIAYRGMISEVLNSFQDVPLPPFGAVLLMLVATNPSAKADLNQIRRAMESLLKDERKLDSHLEGALAFLDSVNRLPAVFHKGPERITMIRSLLENAHNSIKARSGAEVISSFNDRSISNTENPKSGNFIFQFIMDFRPLSILHKRFPDQGKILEKLHQIPKFEELLLESEENSPGEGNQDLIAELIANSKTFQVGALVRRIWTGLSIPYHLALSGDQAIGGVSGVSNSGELDKLLISEYAHDDLIFLSRLANRESLFIRREAPPSKDKNKRIVLIDVSIKNWGIPKVIAHGLLVAIAQHPKNEYQCLAFGVGDQVIPMGYGTVDEVEKSLQILQPVLHPAEGLEEFLKNTSIHKGAEVFFISSEESILFPEMQRVLNDYHKLFNYWINVDRSGTIKLYKNRYKSKHLVQEIVLPLEELWVRTEPNIKEDLTAHNYPILFPMRPIALCTFDLENKVSITITRDKKVFRHQTRATVSGGLLLIGRYDFINKACKFEVGNINGSHVLLVYNPMHKRIYFVDLDTLETKDISGSKLVQHGQYAEFASYEGAFYYGSQYQHCVISFDAKPQINKVNGGLPDVIKEVLEKRKQQSLAFSYRPGSVLKNIKSVFINNVGNLVVNVHELRLAPHGLLMFERSQFLMQKALARKDDSGLFRFPNGHKVRFDDSGMLILESKDQASIFIPLILDCSLGVATHTHFAGDKFYLSPLTNQEQVQVERKYFFEQFIRRFLENILSDAD